MYEEDKWEKMIRKRNDEGDIVVWQSPNTFATMMTKIRVIRKIRGCCGVDAYQIIHEQHMAKLDKMFEYREKNKN